MLRVAYCQISAHPAYCGPNGNYCKEPIYGVNGTILNSLTNISEVNNICNNIEELYMDRFIFKLKQLLHSIKGKEIDILVFPEYTIPAKSLPLIYDFCQKEKCICIAASHTVQGSLGDIYESIHMDISIENNINMSCCPIIFPNDNTRCIFKHYKSKWEANMGVQKYESTNNSCTFSYKGQHITILLCIDALHIDVDKKKTDILIVSAATPSDGSFKNKFESYLMKEIPTIFCNFYLYGNSTVYCSVPANSNLPYAEKTHITKAAANEEVVIIATIDESAQVTKAHSINTTSPIDVEEILPVLYRDDNAEQKAWDQLRDFSEQEDYSKLKEIFSAFSDPTQGIISKKKQYLYSGLCEQTTTFQQIESNSKFIYINDFALKQYEINWLEKSMKIIMDGVTSDKIDMKQIGNPLVQLGQAYQERLPLVNEKVNIPVFDEQAKSNSVFQNRGGEIKQFRNEQKSLYKTVFIVQGFSQIGKSAYIDRLKQLYFFNTIDCPIPKGGGFESLIRWVCEVCNKPLEWESFEEKEIKKYAHYFAYYLTNLNKTIVVIRTTGNLFNAYNQPKTTSFLKFLASKLFEMKSGIKLIIENSRILPKAISTHPNIYICKLKPLYDMFIERLIEQTANNLTYSFSLPQIPKNCIRQCRGNPSIARMIGVCIGDRLNNGQEEFLSQEELEAFSDKYTDGILDALNIAPEERKLLVEAAIYRLQVPEDAFKNFPNYTDYSFKDLRDKLLLEESNGWFSVNPLILSSLKKKSPNRSTLHKIAAEYFNTEYKRTSSNLSKAEYLYHMSFCTSKTLIKDDLRYYANDILSAAIELINNGEIEIGQSHLNSIRFCKENYNNSEFCFYFALCYILNDEYSTYRELFDDCIAETKDKKDVMYYRMIDRLIRARKLPEAENLLNEVGDLYPHTRQMDALWVKLWYKTMQTRRKALSTALKLTKESPGDFYSAKILVYVYLNENMLEEALQEVEAVLDGWPSNGWALNMRYLIHRGKFNIDEEVDFDESE